MSAVCCGSCTDITCYLLLLHLLLQGTTRDESGDMTPLTRSQPGSWSQFSCWNRSMAHFRRVSERHVILLTRSQPGSPQFSCWVENFALFWTSFKQISIRPSKQISAKSQFSCSFIEVWLITDKFQADVTPQPETLFKYSKKQEKLGWFTVVEEYPLIM